MTQHLHIYPVLLKVSRKLIVDKILLCFSLLNAWK